MGVHDLNLIIDICDTFGFIRRGVLHELGQDTVECGEDANLVPRVHRCADCHRQKGASSQCLALHFVTDIIGFRFRENPYFMRLIARY